MARSILRLGDHNKAIFHGCFVVCSLVLLMQEVSAFEFNVGVRGWIGPTRPDEVTYNKWAEMRRFQIGDSLLFVYQPGQDSVLQVTKEDYENCNTAAPIAKFDDGNTSFQLNQSGPYYFISGNEQNCKNNEKMVVIVLADRNQMQSNSTMASPPSPPPPSTVEVIPSPAPVGEQSPDSPPPPPPPSAASSVLMSFVSSVGAFVIGSSAIFVL